MLFNKLFKSEQKTASVRQARTSKNKKKSSITEKTRKNHVKINVKDLRVGMFVRKLDKPWEESCFLLQGVDVTSSDDILTLQKECEHVWVDYDEMSLGNSPGDSTDNRALSAVPTPTIDVRDELNAATGVHSLASEVVSTLFDDIRLGAELDGRAVKQAVSGCVDSILRNQDASLWLTRIQDKDASTAAHSMNVSALSIIMGKAKGFSSNELEDLGVCGMLHDVGKTRLPSVLLDKTTPLTPEERAEMQMHTLYGRDILLASTNVMPGAADVALSHHERPDGTGYPNKLSGDAIPIYSRIVAIAEAYDCMTTVQPYSEAMSPSAALQELYARRGTQFDEELVVSFIDSVGIFPPGSIVEMVNKEVGIVLANTSDKLRPRVIMILDSFGEPALQRVVDLSLLETDSEGKAYQIKTTHHDGAFDINVGEFQRAGLRIG